MKVEPKVIIVVLRRPKTKSDLRTDPFWETGSFGCTRCHNSNLMNPDKGHELVGTRYAFAQGGPDGFKLVHLTPPIEIIRWSAIADDNQDGDFLEAKWAPATMPFKYDTAPILITNEGITDFQRLKTFLKRFIKLKTQSWEGKFSSKFRTCRKLVEKDIAEEIIRVFERKYKKAALAVTYDEALPRELSEPDSKQTRKLKYRDKRRGYVGHQVHNKLAINSSQKAIRKIPKSKKPCK